MTTKTKAAGTGIRAASNTTDPGNSTVSPSCQVGAAADWLQLVVQKTEARIDSRVLATGFGRNHKPVLELIRKYTTELKVLNQLPFQTAIELRRGVPEQFALLTEDQAFFLLNLSRNTPITVHLKLRLTIAFRDARAAAQARPGYIFGHHQLHGAIQRLHVAAVAAGSTTAEAVRHITYERMLNMAAGIKPGQRGNLSHQEGVTLSAVAMVACESIERGLAAGLNRHEIYRLAKSAANGCRLALASGCTDGNIT